MRALPRRDRRPGAGRDPGPVRRAGPRLPGADGARRGRARRRRPVSRSRLPARSARARSSAAGALARGDRDRQADRQDGDRGIRGPPGGPPRARAGRRRDGPRRAAGADRSPRRARWTSTTSSAWSPRGNTPPPTTWRTPSPPAWQRWALVARAVGSPARPTPPTSGRRPTWRPPSAPGLVILEGSGSAIPPVPWDAGILVVPATAPPEYLARLPGPLPPLAVGPGGCYHGWRPIRVRKPFRAPFPCSALPGRYGVHRDGLRSGTAGRHPGQGSVLRYDCASCGRRGVDQTPRSRSRVQGRRVERSAGGSRRLGRRPRCRPGIRRPPHGAEGGGCRYGGRQGPRSRGGGRVRGQPRRGRGGIRGPRHRARRRDRYRRSAEQAPATPLEKKMTRDKTPAHHDLRSRPACPTRRA